jgi:hypothetical protein
VGTPNSLESESFRSMTGGSVAVSETENGLQQQSVGGFPIQLFISGLNFELSSGKLLLKFQFQDVCERGP